MYGLNVPVPGKVAALASDLARDLPQARERERGTHTLSVKRLGGDRAEAYSRLETRVREVLTEQPTFDIHVTEISLFREATLGPAPVVYLAVESPELYRLHRRLAEVFEPVEGIEGNEYTPHVTIARGGSIDRAAAIADREIEPIEWTVSELCFWDAHRSEAASTLSLPT